MDVPSRAGEAKTTFTVLITGANSGLGFAICCRLIDEFLVTRPQSQTLHLIFSTRDARKGDDTLRRLNVHLQKTLREANGRIPGISLLLEARVKIENVLVDLTKLLTVKALAADLLRRGETVDAVIWNAGIAGWTGMNWYSAIWNMVTDLVHATTYPTYMIPGRKLQSNPLVSPSSGKKTESTVDARSDEPQMGQIFLANVFGHYMLTHWITPILAPRSRIICVSSVAALTSSFSIEDLQSLHSETAYEGSKRLTDLLVLTSELPSTRPYTSTFFNTSGRPENAATGQAGSAKPKLYLTHPGVCKTSIDSMHWSLTIFITAALYLARLLGSPWHPVVPYKGAISAVFAALADPDQLEDFEIRDGKGKWGTATGVYGDERVARTEVEGWGFCGAVGKIPAGSVSGKTGAYRGRTETTRETREQFEEEGRRVWKEMEEMRLEWEERLGRVSVADAEDL